MKDGFIKVAAATPEIKVADWRFNSQRIIQCIQEAKGQGASLITFPELCVTAYTCGDLFLQRTLLQGAQQAVASILPHTQDIVAIVGCPVESGGDLFNCAVVMSGGAILGIVPKSVVPNYGEFYELRHFTPAPEENRTVSFCGQPCPFGKKLLFSCETMEDFVLGVEICEDLWVPSPPSVNLALAGATVLCNLSASDETVGKDAYRRELVKSQSARLLCAYLYADAGDGESTTDMVFAGHDLICENGAILAESRLFQNGIVYADLDVASLQYERRRMNTFPPLRQEGFEKISFRLPLRETPLSRQYPMRPFVPGDEADRDLRCEAIFAMQAHGLKKRLEHTRSRCLVVGISGGLDSCLALLVACRAVDLAGRPRTDVLAVTMPCFGTTVRTRSNAEALCEALGVSFRCIDIAKTVSQHLADISHPEGDMNVAYENAQARVRTLVLMDLANDEGGLVVGTGDLSELALGWATYNGDHMSMYGVNAGVPKTLVRYMVGYVAESCGDVRQAQVLQDILDTPVSPELLPAKDGVISQITEDVVGPYDLHDFFLYYMIRRGFSPAKANRLANQSFAGVFDAQTILKWQKVFIRRFFQQQFKRSCLPDGPKVGSATLSPRGDWRMPSDACPEGWLAELEECATLQEK